MDKLREQSLFIGLIDIYPCNIGDFWSFPCEIFLSDFVIVNKFCFRIPPRSADCTFSLTWHVESPFFMMWHADCIINFILIFLWVHVEFIIFKKKLKMN